MSRTKSAVQAKKQIDLFADMHPDIESILRSDGLRIQTILDDIRERDRPVIDAVNLLIERDAAMIHALLKIDAGELTKQEAKAKKRRFATSGK